MNKAAMNSCVHVFVWPCVFISLNKYLGVELLGHKESKLFPQVVL